MHLYLIRSYKAIFKDELNTREDGAIKAIHGSDLGRPDKSW